MGRNFDFNVMKYGGGPSAAGAALRGHASSIQADEKDIEGLFKNIASAAQAFTSANNESKRLELLQKRKEINYTVQTLVNSEDYIQSTQQERVEKLNAFIPQLAQDPTTDQDTMFIWSDVLSPHLSKAMTGAEEERQTDVINNAYLDYQNFEQKVRSANPNIDPKSITENFVTSFSKNKNVPAGNIRDALIHGTSNEIAMLINNATTSQELNEVLKYSQELRAPFKSDKFLESRSLKTSALVTSILSNESTLIEQKKKEFMYKAREEIELANDTSNISKLQHYTQAPTIEKYQEAYPTNYKQKYQAAVHKFNEAQLLRFKASQFDPSKHVYWAKETEDTKEVFQELLDIDISNLISKGKVSEASDLISMHGQADKQRVANMKEFVISGLGQDSTALTTYAMLDQMHSQKPDAFNILFSDYKEKARVLAIGPLSRLMNKTIPETWEYVNGTPTITAEKLSGMQRGGFESVVLDPENPTPLKEELSVMYSTLAAYGMKHQDIIPILQKHKLSKPYKLSLGSAEEDTKDVMKFHLDKMLIYPDGLTYTDSATGTIVQQTPYGDKASIIDIKGLQDYSTQWNHIRQYNQSRWKVAVGAEWVMDNITSAISKAKYAPGRNVLKPEKDPNSYSLKDLFRKDKE